MKLVIFEVPDKDVGEEGLLQAVAEDCGWKLRGVSDAGDLAYSDMLVTRHKNSPSPSPSPERPTGWNQKPR